MAQLDNAADSDSEERGFESLQAGQFKKESIRKDGFFFLILYYPQRDSNKPLRTTVRGDCCLGAATSVSEAIGTGSAETKSLRAGQ